MTNTVRGRMAAQILDLSTPLSLGSMPDHVVLMTTTVHPEGSKVFSCDDHFLHWHQIVPHPHPDHRIDTQGIAGFENEDAAIAFMRAYTPDVLDRKGGTMIQFTLEHALKLTRFKQAKTGATPFALHVFGMRQGELRLVISQYVA